MTYLFFDPLPSRLYYRHRTHTGSTPLFAELVGFIPKSPQDTLPVEEFPASGGITSPRRSIYIIAESAAGVKLLSFEHFPGDILQYPLIRILLDHEFVKLIGQDLHVLKLIDPRYPQP